VEDGCTLWGSPMSSDSRSTDNPNRDYRWPEDGSAFFQVAYIKTKKKKYSSLVHSEVPKSKYFSCMDLWQVCKEKSERSSICQDKAGKKKFPQTTESFSQFF